MKGRFLIYALVIALGSSLMSWSSMAHRAGSGLGSGNSWRTGGSGYSGGGWASSLAGGHK